jgi:hypothetical protein
MNMEAKMPYAYTQDVPIDEAIYRKITERLGPVPLTGLIFHLVVRRPGGGLRYVDVWESPDACQRAFDERIHPAVYHVFSEVGFTPSGEPEKERLDIVDFTCSSAVDKQESAPARP